MQNRCYCTSATQLLDSSCDWNDFERDPIRRLSGRRRTLLEVWRGGSRRSKQLVFVPAACQAESPKPPAGTRFSAHGGELGVTASMCFRDFWRLNYVVFGCWAPSIRWALFLVSVLHLSLAVLSSCVIGLVHLPKSVEDARGFCFLGSRGQRDMNLGCFPSSQSGGF